MLFYILPTGTRICRCLYSWMWERGQVCTVCAPSGASPALLACVAPAAVPCTGLHSWGEPWGRAAAWCTSPYPSFFFFLTLFPLAGPLSLTAHAITEWHSFIYYCTPLPSLLHHHHRFQHTHTHTNSRTDTNIPHVCSHLPWQTNLHIS